MYACHPLPLATRRHFTDKISSKINRTILQVEKTRKPLHTDSQCFLHEFCKLRKKRRIRPLQILKKDRKKKKKTLRNNKDSTNAKPAERRNRRARDSTTTHQKSSGKNYRSKLSQNIMKQKKRKI
jgi:hypothetical protein